MTGPPVRCVVVAGVSGSGKSTVARALAARLGWDFVEGDDLHPAANIAKMASGEPLTDEDRWPWLAAVAARIDKTPPDGGLVVTCSALRRTYRDRLRKDHPWVTFCLVEAPAEIIAARLRTRTGHYMPASLLDSQLATLEPLEPDEPGFVLESTTTLDDSVANAVEALRTGAG